MKTFRCLLILVSIALGIAISLSLLLLPGNGVAQQGYPPPGGNQYVDYQVYLPNLYVYPPEASPSYYVTNLNGLYDLGHALGNHDRDAPGTQTNLVILDFGYPYRIWQGGRYNYGTELVFDPTYTFYPTSTIISSVVEFAHGYYVGTTADDMNSHTRIVVGVNNCCSAVGLAVFQGHGTAWGNAVNLIRSQIAPYSSQVDVVSGMDIEMAWNHPYRIAQWLDYYKSASTCDPGENDSVEGCFYNFGNMTISASGTYCATNDQQTDWYGCDVWYVSWGAQKNGKRFARPLPEIYVRYNPSYPQYPWGQNATAWKDLSLFSANQMSAGKMYFVGTLTQRAECGDGCGSGNNYPWEGFMLLRSALASNPTTNMNLRWATDIQEQH